MGKVDRNPLVIEAISAPDAPYYVYLLIDPETDRPFYVGKGTGERFMAHGIEAAVLEAAGPDVAERRRKVARIQTIRASGNEPRIEFARTAIPTEQEAFAVEAALIDVLERFGIQLVNLVRGHRAEHGLASLLDIERERAAVEFTTLEPAILIRINAGRGYRSDMAFDALYERVRGSWVLSPARAARYRYAVAVHRGITRGVWAIVEGSWQSSQKPGEGVRWSFDGVPASTEIEEAFVGRLGRRVPKLRPNGTVVFGSGSPIAYWPG